MAITNESLAGREARLDRREGLVRPGGDDARRRERRGHGRCVVGREADRFEGSREVFVPSSEGARDQASGDRVLRGLPQQHGRPQHQWQQRREEGRHGEDPAGDHRRPVEGRELMPSGQTGADLALGTCHEVLRPPGAQRTVESFLEGRAREGRGMNQGLRELPAPGRVRARPVVEQLCDRAEPIVERPRSERFPGHAQPALGGPHAFRCGIRPVELDARHRAHFRRSLPNRVIGRTSDDLCRTASSGAASGDRRRTASSGALAA